MPCAICGSPYIQVGKRKVCSKCSHVAGYQKVDILAILQENEHLRKEVEEYKLNWLRAVGINSEN